MVCGSAINSGVRRGGVREQGEGSVVLDVCARGFGRRGTCGERVPRLHLVVGSVGGIKLTALQILGSGNVWESTNGRMSRHYTGVYTEYREMKWR